MRLRKRFRRNDAKGAINDGGASGSSDRAESKGRKVRRITVRTREVLQEAAIIHLALQRPDGREHALRLGLIGKARATKVSPFAFGQTDEEPVLIHGTDASNDT